MARVSSKSFYTEKFGGYAGLMDALEHDFVEIPDFANTDLTQPGKYTNVHVSRITTSPRKARTYDVTFSTSTGSFLHEEEVWTDSPWLKKLKDAGGWDQTKFTLVLRPVPAHKRWQAGIALSKFYLIAPSGQIDRAFNTAKELLAHSYQNGLLPLLKGIELDYVCDIKRSSNQPIVESTD